MGVLAHGYEHARHFVQPPIDTSGNFPAHVSNQFTIYFVGTVWPAGNFEYNETTAQPPIDVSRNFVAHVSSE